MSEYTKAVEAIERELYAEVEQAQKNLDIARRAWMPWWDMLKECQRIDEAEANLVYDEEFAEA